MDGRADPETETGKEGGGGGGGGATTLLPDPAVDM